MNLLLTKYLSNWQRFIRMIAYPPFLFIFIYMITHPRREEWSQVEPPVRVEIIEFMTFEVVFRLDACVFLRIAQMQETALIDVVSSHIIHCGGSSQSGRSSYLTKAAADDEIRFSLSINYNIVICLVVS